jgi:hypothetical protein
MPSGAVQGSAEEEVDSVGGSYSMVLKSGRMGRKGRS